MQDKYVDPDDWVPTGNIYQRIYPPHQKSDPATRNLVITSYQKIPSYSKRVITLFSTDKDSVIVERESLNRPTLEELSCLTCGYPQFTSVIWMGKVRTMAYFKKARSMGMAFNKIATHLRSISRVDEREEVYGFAHIIEGYRFNSMQRLTGTIKLLQPLDMDSEDEGGEWPAPKLHTGKE